MFWMMAALVAGSGDAPRVPVTAERPAYAMVTIVKPAIVHLGDAAIQAGEHVGILRDSVIRPAGASPQPARLIEFP